MELTETVEEYETRIRGRKLALKRQLDGRVTGTALPDDLNSMSYDAAGRLATILTYHPTNTVRHYDGDGRMARIETFDQLNEEQPDEDTTYQLRSTVLGGAIVYDGDHVSIYAGGTRIAMHYNNAVMWNHSDLTAKSYRSTGASGTVLGDGGLGVDWDMIETDPDGKSTGFSAPVYYPLDSNDLFTPGWTFGSMVNGQYTLNVADGLHVPREYIWSRIETRHGSLGLDIILVVARQSEWAVTFDQNRNVTGIKRGRPVELPPGHWWDWIFNFWSPDDLMLPQQTLAGHTDRPTADGSQGEPVQDPIEKAFRDCGGTQVNDWSANTALWLLDIGESPERAAQIYAIWGRESSFVLRGSGDHGPMQLTSWWRNNHPGLVVNGAYDTFSRPSNHPNRQRRFEGDVVANFLTGRKIIEFSLHRYNNSFFDTAFHYGPGAPGDRSGYNDESKKKRKAYANDVVANYNSSISFFNCFNQVIDQLKRNGRIVYQAL